MGSPLNFLFGVLVSLVASLLSTIGVNIQALALKESDHVNTIQSERVNSYTLSLLQRIWIKYRWYFGFVMYLVFSAGGSVVALGFIPPVVLAPLGAVGLIFNILASYWLMGTVITRSDWMGTLLIMLGCALVSIFGVFVPDQNHSIEELIDLFTRPFFIVFFSIQVFAMVVLTIYAVWESSKLQRLQRTFMVAGEQTQLIRHRNSASIKSKSSDTEEEQQRTSSRNSSRTSSPRQSVHRRVSEVNTDIEDDYVDDSDADQAAATSSTADSELSMPLMHLSAKGHHEFIGIIFGMVGGIVGSQSLLLAKSGVGLLIISVVDSKNQFQGAFALTLLASLVILAIWQLYAFNKALYHCLPTLIVPISYTFHTCFSLINSLIYLNQLTGVYSVEQFGVLVSGVVVLIHGVWMLRHRQS